MRNQRRLRTAAAAFAVLAVGLGACGRNEPNTTATTEGTATTVAPDPASKTGQGFDGKTIKVGLLGVQTGIAQSIGLPMIAGQEAYWKRINDKGGVAGKFKVELLKFDTKYTDTEAVVQYNQSKDQVAMYGQILGTNIVNAVKDMLADDGLLGQPATLDAYWVREPNLMPFGAPYQIQAINGLDYAKRKLDAGSKTVCALTKDDDYGKAGLAGYEAAITKLGLKGGVKATFKTGDDMTATVSNLKSGNCGIVLFTGLSLDTSATLGAAATQSYTPKWIALSASWNASLVGTPPGSAPLTSYYQDNFLLAAEGVNWGDESVPGMKQQMADVKASDPNTPPNGYYTFGWNEAWAVHQVLEKAAALGDLTKEGILDASHKIEKLDFGGVYGEYKYGEPDDRMPTPQTTVFKIDATKPNGTDALEKNFISEAAKTYQIP
jgi:ABC-type branched-subunit amino acid transport system substrate-binding protein